MGDTLGSHYGLSDSARGCIVIRYSANITSTNNRYMILHIFGANTRSSNDVQGLWSFDIVEHHSRDLSTYIHG